MLSSSLILLLILYKIYSFSLNHTKLCRNYSTPLSCSRVFYFSFVIFWSAITVCRNSFRFVFHWCYRSVAVYSKVGECCMRRVVWTGAHSRWETARLYHHQDVAEALSLLSISPTYAKRRGMLAKTAFANWAGKNWEVRLACYLYEVQEVIRQNVGCKMVVHLLLCLPSAKANLLSQMVLSSLCGDRKIVLSLFRVGKGNFSFCL